MEPGVGGEPGPDGGGFVGRQVVTDQVQVQLDGYGLVDLVEELFELGCPVSALDGVDDQSGRHVQGGEQVGGPGAGVVEGSSLRHAGHHRQQWC